MTIEDVPERLRNALLSGYAEGHGSHDGGRAPEGMDERAQARWDGERLGNAVTRLVSSDLADWKSDSRNYDAVAAELSERYGAGVVVLGGEMGPEGDPPGFRRRAQASDQEGSS